MNEMVMLGGLVVVSAGLILYSLWPEKSDAKKQVLRRMAGQRREGEQPLVGQGGASSAARQMLDKVAPYAIRPVMPKSDEEMSTLREKLSQAGYRHESASRYFLASKTIAGVALLLVAVLIGMQRGLDIRQLFGMAAFCGGIGFMFPNLWLWIARNQRSEKIRNGLPDSLDLLVVSVESGLALDAGIQRVADEMGNVHPELAEELQIATLETQMGVPRSESLENMARRSGVREMRALVAVIAQAEKFGTSVAKVLRVQADTLRSKRRLRAEERAQKTTVKLMVPLVLFIFPSIFVVLAGPAALKLMQAFGSGGALSGGGK